MNHIYVLFGENPPVDEKKDPKEELTEEEKNKIEEISTSVALRGILHDGDKKTKFDNAELLYFEAVMKASANDASNAYEKEVSNRILAEVQKEVNYRKTHTLKREETAVNKKAKEEAKKNSGYDEKKFNQKYLADTSLGSKKVLSDERKGQIQALAEGIKKGR